MVESVVFGRSNFIGFPDDVVRKSTEFELTHDQPGFEDHENLFCFPGVDALYREDGTIVQSSRQWYFADDMKYPAPAYRKRKFDSKAKMHMPPPREFHVETRGAVFLGNLIPHWGHFLYDSLARLWAISSGSVDPSRDIVLFTSKWPRIPFAEPILSSIGIPPDCMNAPARPTLFKNVRIYLPSVNDMFRISAFHGEIHRHIAAVMQTTRRFDRPVFISRAGLDRSLKTFANEEIIEKAAAKHGYEIIHPEALPIGDQIALFATCPYILGSVGSAFHSILFEPQMGERVRVMLCPVNSGRRFPMVDAVCRGHTSLYLNVAPAVMERNQVVPIDVDKTFEYLNSLPCGW